MHHVMSPHFVEKSCERRLGHLKGIKAKDNAGPPIERLELPLESYATAAGQHERAGETALTFHRFSSGTRRGIRSSICCCVEKPDQQQQQTSIKRRPHLNGLWLL